MASATERHELIFDPAKFNPTPVVIGGVGAGGGSACLGLAKLGVRNITVYDTDVVAIENVGPSIYGRKHVGMRKVDACAAIVHELSDGVEIQPIHRPIESLRGAEGVMFICVDDMDLRKKLVRRYAAQNTKVVRVFEGRMSALSGRSHSFDPRSKEHVKEWMRFWFPQREALPALPGCGARPVSVGPTANMIANLMVTQFVEWFAHVRGEIPKCSNQVRYDAEKYSMEVHYW
jgi:molybdopterin/thiamine biosynthesis adenylyltransferase